MGGRKSAVLWVNQWESHVSYQPSLLYSLYLKITLVQHVAPAVWFAPPDAEPGAMREKKKPLCRSSFLLAAGEQIKETWRRSNSPTPPPFFSPLPFSRLICLPTTGAFPQKIFLEVMDFSGAGTGGRDIYHSEFRLCFTPSIHFRPCSPVWVFLNTLKCTGMESWSSMINHGRLCQGLIHVGHSAEMHFSHWLLICIRRNFHFLKHCMQKEWLTPDRKRRYVGPYSDWTLNTCIVFEC